MNACEGGSEMRKVHCWVCCCFESESRVIHSLHSGMERNCCHGMLHTHTNTEVHSNSQVVVMLCYMAPWSHYLALDPTHSFTYTAFSVDFLQTHAHRHTHTRTSVSPDGQSETQGGKQHPHTQTHMRTAHSGPADKLLHARLIWFTVLSEHR